MDLDIITFQMREEIEVLKESKLLSQVIWSGSTFHTLAALDEKVFLSKACINHGKCDPVFGSSSSSMRVAVFSQHKF